MKKYKTVIIGAGSAGLRCAKVLAENNEDFILLEKNLSLTERSVQASGGSQKRHVTWVFLIVFSRENSIE